MYFSLRNTDLNEVFFFSGFGYDFFLFHFFFQSAIGQCVTLM